AHLGQQLRARHHAGFGIRVRLHDHQYAHGLSPVFRQSAGSNERRTAQAGFDTTAEGLIRISEAMTRQHHYARIVRTQEAIMSASASTTLRPPPPPPRRPLPSPFFLRGS